MQFFGRCGCSGSAIGLNFKLWFMASGRPSSLYKNPIQTCSSNQLTHINLHNGSMCECVCEGCVFDLVCMLSLVVPCEYLVWHITNIAFSSNDRFLKCTSIDRVLDRCTTSDLWWWLWWWRQWYVMWCVVAFDFGGVVTNSRREPDTTNRNKRPGSLKEMHWLAQSRILWCISDLTVRIMILTGLMYLCNGRNERNNVFYLQNKVKCQIWNLRENWCTNLGFGEFLCID